MNLLCPFLSKHSSNRGDISIDAFHGPIDLASWTDAISTQYAASGDLSKANPSATWTIDLHSPCFKGQCAQDNVVPAEFQLPTNLEGTDFGCDLWIEGTGYSTTTAPTLIFGGITSDSPEKFNRISSKCTFEPSTHAKRTFCSEAA